jgi:hypothetical protein
MTDDNLIVAKIGDAPDVHQRRAAISAAPARSRQMVPIGGSYREVPVISVPQRELVYRVGNGRILTELEEHLAQTGGSVAALQADQASATTQSLLHGLLVAKAGDPQGPILQELARHGQQTEPLLITADGVLVNGNRRLAAMRELLARDGKRYAGFEHVMAGVLPQDIGESDIEFVEASLQMAPEVKLAYGWINRRMKLRHQHQVLGLSATAIAEAYRMESPDEVAIELDELKLAERYLSIRKGGLEYSLVADAERLFRSLRAQLADLPLDIRGIWETAGFAMIDGRAAVEGPMDRFFPFAAPVPANMPVWTLRRLAEEDGIVPPPESGRSMARNAELPAAAIPPLEQKLADPERGRENATSLFGLMEQLRAEYLEERAPHSALRLITRARAALAGVEVGRMTRRQLRQLRSEMIALEASVSTLLGEEPAIPATEPPPPANLLQRLLGRD